MPTIQGTTNNQLKSNGIHILKCHIDIWEHDVEINIVIISRCLIYVSA